MAREGLTYLIQAVYRTVGKRQFVQGFQHIDKAVARHKEELRGFRATHVKTFQKTMPDGQKRLAGFGATLRNNEGQVKQLTASYDKFGNVTTSKVRDINAAQTHLNRSLKKGGAGADDFINAMKRAIIVAPIWMAMRSAMMQVIRTISDGVRIMEQYSRALNKTEQVMHGITGTARDFGKVLDKEIRETAMKTGTQIDQLADYFYRFGTVGLDATKSIEGMTAANKIAIAMFAEQREGVEIARMLAESYRLLGDTIDDTIPEHLQMEAVGAKLLHLWRYNAFEIGEMAGAMRQFLPTAAAFNFTMDESVALMASLHSAALKGTRAGRLFRTSQAQLASNLNDAAMELGINIRENDRLFDVLMKVIGGIRDISAAGGEIPDMDLFQLFGGVRSREAALSLLALGEQLEKNLEIAAVGGEDLLRLIDDFNDSYEHQLDQTYKQMERFRTLRGLVGEAFVTGITGAEDFADGLKNINEYVEKSLTPTMKSIGGFINEWSPSIITILGLIAAAKGALIAIPALLVGINSLLNKMEESGSKIVNVMGRIMEFTTGFFPYRNQLRLYEKTIKEGEKLIDINERIAKGIRGKIDKESLKKLIDELEDPEIIAKLEFPEGQIDRFKNQLKDVLEREDFGIDIAVNNEEIEKAEQTQLKIRGELERKLELLKQEQKYVEMVRKGYSEQEISMQKLRDYLGQHVRLFNEMNDVQEGKIDTIDKEVALSAVLKQDYEKIRELFGRHRMEKENILELERLRQDVVQKQSAQEQRIQSALVSHVEQMLRMQGATTIQMVEARRQLEQALGIRIDTITQLGRELELQRAITQEHLDRNKASSDTLKLHEIAQKYGKNQARIIGEILSGERDIGYYLDHQRGTIDILNEYYENLVQQAKARRFMERRAPFIPIAERGIETRDITPTRLLSEQINRLPEHLREGYDMLEQMTKAISELKLPKIDTNIQNININVKKALTNGLRQENVSQNIVDEIVEKIRTDAKVRSAIERVIEEY